MARIRSPPVSYIEQHNTEFIYRKGKEPDASFKHPAFWLYAVRLLLLGVVLKKRHADKDPAHGQIVGAPYSRLYFAQTAFLGAGKERDRERLFSRLRLTHRLYHGKPQLVLRGEPKLATFERLRLLALVPELVVSNRQSLAAIPPRPPAM
jgi:hypothetical protein